jgi:O-methyltransferase
VTPVARQLYLDLLIRTLANTIYQDPSIHPENEGPFRGELRAEGRDWPAIAHTMVGLRRLENLRDLAQRALDQEISAISSKPAFGVAAAAF